MLIALLILLVSPLVARVVGRAVSRRLAATPGAVGARMPRLPDEEGLGRGQRKLLKWLINHPNDVEAAAAAAAVHLTPERVEAWLEGLALRLPCRVRITRRGQATYDFEPADLSAELRRDVLRGLGRPFAWVGLALINLGASWPLLFSIGLVAGGLASITSWEDEFIYFGVGILVGVAVLAAGVLAISALLGWIMGPPTGTEVAPEGGGALSPRQQARALERDQRVRERARRSQKPVLEEPPKKKSRSWDIGNIDDPRGLLVIVVAILLLVVVGSALVGLYAWGVGLWRSLSGHRLHAEWMGPAAWARQQPKADSWMRLVPTNDMVGRAVRSLRAALRRPRPADGHLADRVAALVRRGRGRLSSLELALHEGLDPDDAIEVLTRICVRHEGRIVVSRSGDLVVFIPVFARASDTEGVPPFEALVGQGGGQVVSLPGLEAADRDAAARLAGGTWLLALGTAWLVAEAPGAWAVVGWVAAAVSLAVTCLAAAVRHAIRAHAGLARLRDARRHAGRLLVPSERVAGESELAETPASAAPGAITLEALVNEVARALGKAGAEERASIRTELQAWLEALGLPDGRVVDRSLLATRLAEAAALPTPRAGEADDDVVVFDTTWPAQGFASRKAIAQ